MDVAGKPLDRDKLAQTIEGGHAMAAILLKSPALAITSKEAKLLAEGVAAVAAQYRVVINPRLLALGELGGACLAVYGPRLLAAAFAPKKKPAHDPAGMPLGSELLDAMTHGAGKPH